MPAVEHSIGFNEGPVIENPREFSFLFCFFSYCSFTVKILLFFLYAYCLICVLPGLSQLGDPRSSWSRHSALVPN